MEIVLIIAVVVVALVVLALSPMTRRAGDASDAEVRAAARGADVDRQFHRPRDEGDLL